MPSDVTMNRDEFIRYLEECLIPDLEESGEEQTAADFKAAVRFLNGAETVTFRNYGESDNGN